MPLINVFTSKTPPAPERIDALLLNLSRTLARELGKTAPHLFGFNGETFA